MPFTFIARAYDLSMASGQLVKIMTHSLCISENSRYSRLVDLVALAVFSADLPCEILDS